jgi:autotransporter family porin
VRSTCTLPPVSSSTQSSAMLARNGRNPIAEENSVRVVGGGAVDADLTQLASYKDPDRDELHRGQRRAGLNTFLAADGSPSDRLVINGGTASGLTFLTWPTRGARAP